MAEVMRYNCLRLTIVLWLWTQPIVHARNITIQDSDAAIVYQPPGNWHASSPSCSKCLVPSSKGSYHQANDFISFSRRNLPSTSLSVSSSDLLGAFIPHPPSGRFPSSHDTRSAIRLSTTSVCGALRTDDSAPCLDPPPRLKNGLRKRGEEALSTALMSFNFTGSAIYLFALSAQEGGRNTPIVQDVTVRLDNHLSVTTTSAPSDGGTSPFYAATDLQNTSHHLVISIDHNSVFLFDYLIYTTPQLEDSPSTPTSSQIGTALSQESPSPTTRPRRNVSTFAIAIGCTVGVLGLFSLGLAISIIRRRQISKQRERPTQGGRSRGSDDTESLHTDGSDDSPNMSGPVPFTPRFFPGTILPPDPPAYNDAVRHNTRRYGADTSYADVPPPNPPPDAEEPYDIHGLNMYLAPPPFQSPTPEPHVIQSRRRPSLRAIEEEDGQSLAIPPGIDHAGVLHATLDDDETQGLRRSSSSSRRTSSLLSTSPTPTVAETGPEVVADTTFTSDQPPQPSPPSRQHPDI